MSKTHPLLESSLAVLAPYLNHPGIEEIAINREKEIWCKYRSATRDTTVMHKAGWQKVEDASITERYILGLCQKLANLHHLPFTAQGMPILSSTLPGGHRLQAIVGANVRYDYQDMQGIACCIRLFSQEKRVQIEDFGLEGARPLKAVKRHHKKQRYSEHPLEDLTCAIGHGEAVLISGATSTGKTSFLNDLVTYIPLSKRIITIEDTREVMIPHPNRLHLLTSRTDALNNVGYSEILDVVVRLTPDVLIAGEVSMKNAAGIHRLMTTGHTNFMATIHASSPEEALKAFYQNLLHTQPHMQPGLAMEILTEAIGRIVQIERVGEARVVTAIEIPMPP